MGKRILIIFCVISILLCSGCGVNFIHVHMEGVYESEDPKMRIVAVNNANDMNDYGEIVYSDGSTQKIALAIGQGRFFLRKYREDGWYDDRTDLLLKGEARQKGDNIILYVDDGSQVVLRKVADLPENSIPTSTSNASSE